ncbi:protein kinase, partial [Trichocladium antarcticum]
QQDELENPYPRKEVDGRIIYVSRQLNVPKRLGLPVLCDFGSLVSGEQLNITDVQPDIYRGPEMLFGIPWRYEIDIWNVGCMVWDMFEGGHLFSGNDPEHQTYRGRAHLASIIGLLGHPPADLIARSSVKSKFLSEEGDFNAGIPLPPPRSLDEIETNLEGKDKELFLQFMRKMLQWAPEHRSSAKDLLQDPWLKGQL